MSLRAVVRHVWVVLLVANLAVLAAIAFTSRAVPQYESSGTYVIGPAANLTSPETIVRSFDSLQGQGIVPTLVELLSSRTIAARVGQPLGLSIDELDQYTVRANVLSASNTLQLTVVGPDPALSAGLAAGVGREASSVFERLYGVYQIEQLDVPRAPEAPISPDLVRNCLLALLLGLSAGGALSVLRHRYPVLLRPVESATTGPSGQQGGAVPAEPQPAEGTTATSFAAGSRAG